jgi:DNA-binding PadR family transcriptional regulator
MKFDLDKEGLETVLLPWQVELMRWIWSADGEVDSRMAHAHLQESETPMSRATAINFLNEMVEEGFLEYRETTTKGGRKRLYRPSPAAPDEEGFRKLLAESVTDKARRELMEDEKR